MKGGLKKTQLSVICFFFNLMCCKIITWTLMVTARLASLRIWNIQLALLLLASPDLYLCSILTADIEQKDSTS